MRFYTQQHRFYCRIDLHAKRMYICVLNAFGFAFCSRMCYPLIVCQLHPRNPRESGHFEGLVHGPGASSRHEQEAGSDRRTSGGIGDPQDRGPHPGGGIAPQGTFAIAMKVPE